MELTGVTRGEMPKGERTMEQDNGSQVDGAGNVRVQRFIRRGVKQEDIPAEDVETADAVADLVAERDCYRKALEDAEFHFLRIACHQIYDADIASYASDVGDCIHRVLHGEA
jgi:hypothetical protein